MRDRSGKNNPAYRGGYATKCVVCKAAVWVKPSKAGQAWYTCSKACEGKQKSRTTTGPDHWRYQGGDVERTCEACGERFHQRRAEFNRSPGKYCSRACQNAGRRKRAYKTCEVCLADFDAPAGKAGVRYCSRRCKQLSQVKDRTIEEIARLRINNSHTALMGYALKGKKAGCKWEKLVGYTLADLMAHLEAKFADGMTWENYGEWHIDHIKPRSMFSYAAPTDPEFLECWALSNLQPLWELDNLRKGAKYVKPEPDPEV